MQTLSCSRLENKEHREEIGFGTDVLYILCAVGKHKPRTFKGLVLGRTRLTRVLSRVFEG